MSEIITNSKISKIIDVYIKKETSLNDKEERNNFFQNKMMKFYKIIKEEKNPKNSTLFMSDNKGEVYMCKLYENNIASNITNLKYLCDDSKYILVDIIKSVKYDFYISLSLNPCINVFKIKSNSNTGEKEIEKLFHINIKNKNKIKYNKILEFNTKKRDYILLFGEDIIELWSKKENDNNKVSYQRTHILKNEKKNIGNDEPISNKIINIYKVDDEKLILFNKSNLEFINIKISESKNKKNSSSIEIINKIKINDIKEQIENINSLFIDKDYIFLGLFDSLILVNASFGEIIQIYKIGKVIQMKMTNDKKYIIIFVESKENEYYFIKYKFIEYFALEEDSRMKYDKWIYKFDVIENGEYIAIYDIKGLITLLKYEKLN
jgi:hypothetical protein